MESKKFLQQLVAAIGMQQVGVRWFEALAEGSWHYKSSHSIVVDGQIKTDYEPIIFTENFDYRIPQSFTKQFLEFIFTVEQMERLFYNCQIKLNLESVFLTIEGNEMTEIKLGFGFSVVDNGSKLGKGIIAVNGYDTLLHLDWYRRKEHQEKETLNEIIARLIIEGNTGGGIMGQ